MGMFRQLMGTGAHRRDPLHGIHYVCDFDAKGRSNDEDEPMRSTWTDKATGKVIDLHNYAYAGMSGWGGYTQDITNWTTQGTDNTIESNCYVFRTVRLAVNFICRNPAAGQQRMKVRISGLKKLIDSGELSRIRLYANNISLIHDFFDDGDHDVSFNVPEDTSFLYLYAVKPNIETDIWQPLSSPVIAELLPLYPGALCSDGVDDYGLTQEAINEEVGTIICHYKNLKVNPPETPSGRFSYIYEITNSMPNTDNGRMYLVCTGTNIMIMGEGGTYSSDEPLSSHLKIPKNYNNKMSLFSRVNTVAEIGFAAIYRLILIREQLDDAQVEFLKSKVIREYNEWCRDKGYDYAIING